MLALAATRQRCTGLNDNPNDVGGSVVAVPAGGSPMVGLVNTVGCVGCCDEGLHQEQLGNDESLDGRRRCDSSYGNNSFTMVGAAGGGDDVDDDSRHSTSVARQKVCPTTTETSKRRL